MHDATNNFQTSFEFRELLIRNLDLYGNAFAGIERNGRGEVIALYPFAPRTVAVQRLSNGRLRYKISNELGGTQVLLAEEMLHVPGPSRDGVVGLSPISIARGALTLALAQEQTANTLATGFRGKLADV